jgi:hypothetical protein
MTIQSFGGSDFLDRTRSGAPQLDAFGFIGHGNLIVQGIKQALQGGSMSMFGVVAQLMG